MKKLTSLDTSFDPSSVADLYNDWATLVVQYRQKNYDKLSDDERQDLKKYAMTLLDYVDEWSAENAADISDEVRAALNKTVVITGEIKKSIRNLNNIQKGIAVVSCMVGLGHSILSKNFAEINDSLNELMEKWNS